MNNGLPAGDKGPAIPDHELLRRIGRGSYGEVWLARNIMGTYRGVKIVYRAGFDSERPYDREFNGLQQFEPVSRTHPGLVSILHMGRNDQAGYFYCVMEIADDLSSGQAIVPERYQPRTLAAELSRNGRLPLSRCLEWGESLARALNHLHSGGLVHRDIKPSNIIFTLGLPKLADIGLVTRARAPISSKATLVGTEGYLAPEGPGSPAADLYSLGRVIYEIAFGKTQDQFPELPTGLRALPDATELMRLNAIILKACDRQPARRFRSAADLGTALAQLRTDLGAKTQGIPSATHGLPALGSKIVILGPLEPSETQLARQLAERLTAEGATVFIDGERELSVAWARRLEQEILSAQVVIALITGSSLYSELTAYGLELAQQAARRRAGLPKLLVVGPDARAPLPPPLAVALEGATMVGPAEDPALSLENIIQALRMPAPN